MTDRRQRVIFILPTLIAGGAERVLITLMNHLDREKFDPHFIVVNNTGPLKDWIDPAMPFHSLGRTKLRSALPRLLKKLNTLQPDIVVSTMAGMNFTVLLAKTFLKRPARFIIREAVVPSSIIKTQAFPAMVRAAYKRLYPRADLIIAPAGCIIEELKNDIGLKDLNYALLHNPVDMNRLTGEWSVETEITGKRRETVHFIAAGRLHPQKGFDRLLKILPRLSHRNWHLKILGQGPEKEKLKNLIKEHDLGDHVKLMGLVKNPWPLYAEADAFLLPSRWEGLPNVALESLAVGTPVIASKSAGGIDEIAALANGAVKTAANMDEFLKEMETVKPNPSASYRAALLPAEFQLENIMEKFTNLLTNP